MPLPQPPAVRAFDDIPGIRDRIYSRIQSAYTSAYPIENKQYRLELSGVDYDRNEPVDIARQKRALITGKSMYRTLHGNFSLVDKATGQVVDSRRGRVARVPHLTDRGTFIQRGNEYTLASQLRLRPGVYTRRKETGELESHFNIMPGSGPSFRVFLEPETGVFRARVGQAKLPLYPLLNAMGVDDNALSEAWGRDLVLVNKAKNSPALVQKAFLKFTNRRAQLATGDAAPGDVDVRAKLKEAFDKMELDPDVTEKTLGKRYDRVSPEVVLAAAKKLIAISKNEGDVDDRDNIAFQKVMGPEDLFEERVLRDAGRASRDLLWKATFRRSLDPVVSSDARSKQLEGVLLNSGLGLAVEESNPADIYDQITRVTRMGEGGIPSTQSIPDESRAVQPSYLAFIDPVRTSESEKAGVDNRAVFGSLKGDDGQLYARLLDKQGQPTLVSSRDAAGGVIAFPGELARAQADNWPVYAMNRGQLDMVDPQEVNYEMPSPEGMMSAPAHLIPLLSSIKGHRMVMTARYFNQALPLVEPEAPLVRSKKDNPNDPNDSFERLFGTKMGAVYSDTDGVVEKVTPEAIHVRSGRDVKKIDLYHDFPFNRMTFISNKPMVRQGDQVKAGQLLAKSNYTDDEGNMALGRNLRVGYMPYKGMTFEDAVVLSEGAAAKLKSEHMFQHDVDIEEGQRVSKNAYIAKFPSVYPKRILNNFGHDGVVKPGTIVQKGDPLILSMKERPKKGLGILHKSGRDAWTDATEVWNHDAEGTVTDVHVGPRSINVIVKAHLPMQVGDKITNRMASKGVVSTIIPDDQMPRGEDGKPLEILIQPFGLNSRTNPALAHEAALGKIAAKTGKPYVVPGFSEDSLENFVAKELQKNGMSSTEDLFDPSRNTKIPKVFVGNQWFMKLHHMAEKKLSGRGESAGYTADMLPAKGGDEGSKRLGFMETMSLLSAGATETLRDAKLLRGQKNDDFWRAFRMGQSPPTPDVPFVYRKFFEDLKGAGINVQKKGGYVHIMAMTDKDVDKMSRGPVTKAETFDFDKMEPIRGGLFDLGRTGGSSGTGWSHIPLVEPMPNPVMEEPIRHLLGLTEDKFRKVLSGEEPLDGAVGGVAIRNALQKIKPKQELERAKEVVKSGPRSRRDSAIKKMRVLTMFEKTGIKPEELVLHKVPVLPPQFRPIINTPDRVLVSHPNFLYKELMLANDNVRDIRKELGEKNVGRERLDLYDAFKAVTGLGDPIQPELQNKRVRGILAHAIGKGSSPKQSDFQRKVLGSSVDLVGRAVITPNPSLDMDHVGLPEEKAWTLYRPFIIRGLVRKGYPATLATRMASERDKRAKDILLAEMEHRPVIINRAPTMHRFGIMAAYPVLTKGHTLQVPPITTSGFNADFDGDAEQFHLPVSPEAVAEAKAKLMPSKNLTDVRSFDVHYTPSLEFLQGLFEGTDPTPDKKHRDVRVFRNKADVISAFRRGEIGPRDTVKIMG